MVQGQVMQTCSERSIFALRGMKFTCQSPPWFSRFMTWSDSSGMFVSSLTHRRGRHSLTVDRLFITWMPPPLQKGASFPPLPLSPGTRCRCGVVSEGGSDDRFRTSQCKCQTHLSADKQTYEHYSCCFLAAENQVARASLVARLS